VIKNRFILADVAYLKEDKCWVGIGHDSWRSQRRQN